MLDLLKLILGALALVGQFVLWALASVVNLLIAGVGAFINLMANLMPPMPSPPSGPGDNVIGWLTWVVPLGPMLAGFAIFLSIWGLWLIIRIPLRWAKIV